MEEQKKSRGLDLARLLLLSQSRISRFIRRNYASPYLVYHCRFPCGLCRESAYAYTSITWTVVLGIVGSIIGGAVTHLFYPPSAGGRFHPGGLIVSILGAILVLYLWHRFRLQVPRG
jgi:uncharacterized membrane protein YeaQ/YmgE (transglycosylase-associated protein family)